MDILIDIFESFGILLLYCLAVFILTLLFSCKQSKYANGTIKHTRRENIKFLILDIKRNRFGILAIAFSSGMYLSEDRILITKILYAIAFLISGFMLFKSNKS